MTETKYNPYRFRDRAQQYDERKRPSTFRRVISENDGSPDYWERYAKELETTVVDQALMVKTLREEVYRLRSQAPKKESDAGDLEAVAPSGYVWSDSPVAPGAR